MSTKPYQKQIGFRLIDFLGERSLEAIRKFGQVNVDFRTHKVHFHRHAPLKKKHGSH